MLDRLEGPDRDPELGPLPGISDRLIEDRLGSADTDGRDPDVAVVEQPGHQAPVADALPVGDLDLVKVERSGAAQGVNRPVRLDPDAVGGGLDQEYQGAVRAPCHDRHAIGANEIRDQPFGAPEPVPPPSRRFRGHR